MSACATCELADCACRSGMTTVTAAGDTSEDARTLAEGYLGRRGYVGELIGTRRRRTRLGMIGYRAWDFRFRVTR